MILVDGQSSIMPDQRKFRELRLSLQNYRMMEPHNRGVDAERL
jgi:hypothetical protein